MPAHIHAFGTAVPRNRYDQDFVRDTVARWVGADRRIRRLLSRAFDRSTVRQRYSVLEEFATGTGPFLDGDAYAGPPTSVRNELYAREARGLARGAAEDALRAAGVGPQRVTHVVTVSCTGFVAPGPDVHLVRDLGLRPSTQRTHIGFMGCYGAFPGLRTARAICAADPGAVVLVACVELCTLHLDPEPTLDSLMATALFADGAAAAVVSAERPSGRRGLALERFATALTDDDDDMAWTIGDRGFRMRLSGYVPKILTAEIPGALEPLWCVEGARGPAHDDGGPDAVGRWAVHPGGPAILDAVQTAMCLRDDALEASREVLRTYGNMSSATIFFVLRRLLEQEPSPGERVAALAFGPGLTVESGLFTVA